ncbi:hypothetical protein [Streptomyces hydrogenans]|uniref:hypothetical protein n=1 Tax=Streptomyces hydrogenans TaxID=1873719 RepID=UPI0037FF4BF3
MARISLNQRLARLEGLMQPHTAAALTRATALANRLEEATSQPLAVALHDSECPLGRAGQPPLRAADTTNVITVARWFIGASRGKQPLCPLCCPHPTEESA